MTRIPFFILAVLPLSLWSQKEVDNKLADINYDRSALYAHSWNLVELNGYPTVSPEIKKAYIIFKPGDDEYNRITGFTGCNYMIGRIDLKGEDEIKFTPNIITNNNCGGGSLELPLLDVLAETDRWAEKGGQLFLYKKGKVIAKWNPSAYLNTTLNGVWQLYYLRDHTIPFTDLYPVTNRPSMIFSWSANSVSGYSGCHEFSCPVLINTNSMVFANNAVVQDTTCNSKGEYVFMNGLNKVTGYAFKDDKTLVLIANSEPLMAFTKIK
jgi:heat shock protein HslJ